MALNVLVVAILALVIGLRSVSPDIAFSVS
jgi:hypothetical protein